MSIPIIGAGGPTDKASIPLATRRGTYIPNERRREWAPEQMKDAIEIRRKTNPLAHLRSATAAYNCMGQVFASRRTCIDIEEVRLILQEDGYYRLASLQEADIGDVVVYCRKGTPEHVGVIIELPVDCGYVTKQATVMSKWGFEGEYIHLLNDVPSAFGQATEFWSDRKGLTT